MKIKDCLELGQESGLSTVGEAILNIELHYGIFPYDKLVDEFSELYNEYELLRLFDDMLIQNVLKEIGEKR